MPLTHRIACNIPAKQLLCVLCNALSGQPGFAVVRAAHGDPTLISNDSTCTLIYMEPRANLKVCTNQIHFEQFPTSPMAAAAALEFGAHAGAWFGALDVFIDRFGLDNPEANEPPPILTAITYEAGTTFEKIAALPNGTDLVCAFAYASVLVLPDDTSKPIRRVCFNQACRSEPDFNQWLSFLIDQHEGTSEPLRAGDFIEEIPLKDYVERVETIKAAICEGRVYQVNLTQRIRQRSQSSCAQRIYSIFAQNPAKHAFALRLDSSRVIISASPELFLARHVSRVVSEPIKGTCKRHAYTHSDAKLRSELQQSEKDHAELAMIVDLIRNDLARVALPGSVSVEAHRELMTLPYVYHLFSRVCAQVASETKLSELLAATFPCGSITGAPKIAAMQTIRALERSPRGYYCGALGYIRNHQSFSLNVAIRSGLLEQDSFTFGVGGGVVYDSQALAEHAECIAKAQVFLAN